MVSAMTSATTSAILQLMQVLKKSTIALQKLSQGCFFLPFLFTPMLALSEDITIFIGDAAVKQHEEILSGLIDTLEVDGQQNSFKVNRLKKPESTEIFKNNMNSKVAVFIGDTPIQELKNNQSKIGPFTQPTVIVGSLTGREFQSSRESATFLIDYEVPIISSVNIIRDVFEKPIRKIGVIHGKAWDPLRIKNTTLLAQENIQLKAVRLNQRQLNSAQFLEKTIQKMIRSDIDMLWIPNDSKLLSSKNLLEAWIPSFSKSQIPVVVGVEQLIYTRYGLGTFVIEPNTVELGVQVAYLVFDILDPAVTDIAPIQLPVSISKGVNIELLKKRSVDFKPEGLTTFDQVID